MSPVRTPTTIAVSTKPNNRPGCSDGADGRYTASRIRPISRVHTYSLLANLAVGILTVLTEWAPEHLGDVDHWPELATQMLRDALSVAREPQEARIDV